MQWGPTCCMKEFRHQPIPEFHIRVCYMSMSDFCIKFPVHRAGYSIQGVCSHNQHPADEGESESPRWFLCMQFPGNARSLPRHHRQTPERLSVPPTRRRLHRNSISFVAVGSGFPAYNWQRTRMAHSAVVEETHDSHNRAIHVDSQVTDHGCHPLHPAQAPFGRQGCTPAGVHCSTPPTCAIPTACFLRASTSLAPPGGSSAPLKLGSTTLPNCQPPSLPTPHQRTIVSFCAVIAAAKYGVCKTNAVQM